MRDLAQIIRLGAGADILGLVDALLALLESVEALAAAGDEERGVDLLAGVFLAARGARDAWRRCIGETGPAYLQADAQYRAYLAHEADK